MLCFKSSALDKKGRQEIVTFGCDMITAPLRTRRSAGSGTPIQCQSLSRCHTVGLTIGRALISCTSLLQILMPHHRRSSRAVLPEMANKPDHAIT
jgi:hypothetical protein